MSVSNKMHKFIKKNVNVESFMVQEVFICIVILRIILMHWHRARSYKRRQYPGRVGDGATRSLKRLDILTNELIRYLHDQGCCLRLYKRTHNITIE